MSLIKWAVGFLAFQILVVVLLIGIADAFSTATYDDNGINDYSQNSSAVVDVDELGLLGRFTYSVSNIPFPFNVLTFIPTIISVVIGLAYVRGVN